MEKFSPNSASIVGAWELISFEIQKENGEVIYPFGKTNSLIGDFAKMVTRELAESEEHKSLVRMMLNYFRNQGYTNLRADLENETSPEQIGDHIPDLTCNKNDFGRTFMILEAETCSTISDEHTESQWRTFYRKARQVEGEFHLVVPRICGDDSGRDLANQRLRELGITADTVWTPSARS